METPYSKTADLQARFPSCTVTTNPKKRKKVIAQAVAFFCVYAIILSTIGGELWNSEPIKTASCW